MMKKTSAETMLLMENMVGVTFEIGSKGGKWWRYPLRTPSNLQSPLLRLRRYHMFDVVVLCSTDCRRCCFVQPPSLRRRSWQQDKAQIISAVCIVAASVMLLGLLLPAPEALTCTRARLPVPAGSAPWLRLSTIVWVTRPQRLRGCCW